MVGSEGRSFGLSVTAPSVVISGWSPAVFLVGVGLTAAAGMLLHVVGDMTREVGWPVASALLAAGLLTSWGLEVRQSASLRDPDARWLLAAALASPWVALTAGWFVALPIRTIACVGLAAVAFFVGFGFRLEISAAGVRVARTWWRIPVKRWFLSLASDIDIDDDFDGSSSVRIVDSREKRAVELGVVCDDERLLRAFRNAVAQFGGRRPSSAYRG